MLWGRVRVAGVRRPPSRTPVPGKLRLSRRSWKGTNRPVDAAQLVQRASEGDQAAWNAIVDQFNGLLWSVVRAHRLSPSDGAEVIQTTWLRLVENLDRIREPERVGAWLATTTRHECLRFIRRNAREVATSEVEAAEPSNGASIDGPSLDRARRRTLEGIRVARRAMSDAAPRPDGRRSSELRRGVGLPGDADRSDRPDAPALPRAASARSRPCRVPPRPLGGDLMDSGNQGSSVPRDPDEALLAELRRLAARVDPLPESLNRAARETLTWRRVDAELAELLADSSEDDARLELVRAAGGPRSVSFGAAGLTIELEVIGVGARKTIVGQLVPPSQAEIEVQTSEVRVSVSADERGRFRAEGVPSGRVRLRLTATRRRDGPWRRAGSPSSYARH